MWWCCIAGTVTRRIYCAKARQRTDVLSAFIHSTTSSLTEPIHDKVEAHLFRFAHPCFTVACRTFLTPGKNIHCHLPSNKTPEWWLFGRSAAMFVASGSCDAYFYVIKGCMSLCTCLCALHEWASNCFCFVPLEEQRMQKVIITIFCCLVDRCIFLSLWIQSVRVCFGSTHKCFSFGTCVLLANCVQFFAGVSFNCSKLAECARSAKE